MKEKFEKPVIVKYEMRLNENIAVSGPEIEELVKYEGWRFSHDNTDSFYYNGTCYHYLSANIGDPKWRMDSLQSFDKIHFVLELASLIASYNDDEDLGNDIYVTNCAGYSK